MTFANIITVCTNKTEHITDLTSDIPETYVPYSEIELYGIPSDWEEDKVDRVLNELEEPVPIGKVTGYLVLGQAIFLNGGDIVDFCDAVSQPIENAASALTEKNGPLTDDSNLFHIMDFNISDTADSDDIQTLLTELPDIIFTHMHVIPDIISVCPEPLPHEKSKMKKIQEGFAMIAYNETSKRVFHMEDEGTNPDAPQIQISPEQLNIVMGRRNVGDSYPEQHIDHAAWQPFIDNDFEEWLNTRVLYKKCF